MTFAVETAARRGVDVRVIIPKHEDPTLMDAGNLSTAKGLILAGAKVLVCPAMTHLKVMICDDWASVGSANFDTLSIRMNRELNLAFPGRSAVRELEKSVFLPDLRKSRRIFLQETQGMVNSIADTLADQF